MSQGVRPEQIVYTTFTRAGAYEARDRAVAKFGYSEDEFPYFRTLHSLCYRRLGGGPVMSQKDWFSIGHQLGLSFSFGRFDGAEFAYATKGDHMLNIWGLSRTRLIPLEDAHAEYQENHVCSFGELEHFVRTIADYKEGYGKMDYTDILERFANEKPDMSEITHMFVDEAQDLSNIQIRVVEHIGAYATKGVWIGGDDDQCLHEWNGANAQWFIDLEADLQVLDQSYRVPSSVHEVAERIAGRISKRIEKPYKPRDVRGEVVITDPLSLDMSEGNWLILCRNRVFFDMFEGICIQNGWPYHGGNERNDREFVEAARIYQRVHQGQMVTIQEARKMYGHISREHIRYGGKKALQDANDNRMVNAEILVREFGLKDLKTTQDMMDRGSARQLSYLNTLIESGEFIVTPRIEISTIHNAKGRECENVVVCPDMSYKSYTSFQDNPDPEHRVFYVAVTRAKERLVLLQPITKRYYEI